MNRQGKRVTEAQPVTIRVNSSRAHTVLLLLSWNYCFYIEFLPTSTSHNYLFTF